MPTELATEIRDICANDRYTRVLINDFAFGSLHLPDSSKGLDALNSVLDMISHDIQELKTKWKARHFIFGADLNVTLPANIDGHTGGNVHGNPHASWEWDALVFEWVQEHGFRALNTFPSELRDMFDKSWWTHENSHKKSKFQIDYVLVTGDIDGEAGTQSSWRYGRDHLP
eukprot:6663840-Karenia_brevis.AAC.1